MPFVQLSLILNSNETSRLHYKKYFTIFYACGLARSSLLLRSTEVSHFLQSINTMRLIFLVSLCIKTENRHWYISGLHLFTKTGQTPSWHHILNRQVGGYTLIPRFLLYLKSPFFVRNVRKAISDTSFLCKDKIQFSLKSFLYNYICKCF